MIKTDFKQEFQKISDTIQNNAKILLASHERPDGDALGSMIAMFCALKQLPGKDVLMFSKDPVPDHFKFLPRASEIIVGGDYFKAADSLFGQEGPDIFVAFDYGDFSRLGIREEYIKNSFVITFDHHPLFNQKGDIKIIDDSLSSTCELLYSFFINQRYNISPESATALLTGIFTDTGGLAHINTSHNTLLAVGDLLKRGGVFLKTLYGHTFSSKSLGDLKAWGAALKNTLKDESINMSYSCISFGELKKLSVPLDAFEGVANLINTPPDVNFSLMLIEREPGIIKGSLRSESFKRVDVARIARALGGGGHEYAAGFEMKGESLKNVVEYVKRAANEAS